MRLGGIESFDADDREVVAVDLEGVGGVAENLDAARLVGLHPDGRVGLADVTQQWSDTHLGHMAIMPEKRAVSARSADSRRDVRPAPTAVGEDADDGSTARGSSVGDGILRFRRSRSEPVQRRVVGYGPAGRSNLADVVHRGCHRRASSMALEDHRGVMALCAGARREYTDVTLQPGRRSLVACISWRSVVNYEIVLIATEATGRALRPVGSVLDTMTTLSM